MFQDLQSWIVNLIFIVHSMKHKGWGEDSVDKVHSVEA